MPRRNLLIFFALSTLAQGAIWPDQFGHYKLDSTKTPAISDKDLWDEYGLDLAEQGLYSDGAKKLTATAWRMKDPTGAWAVFQWIRPAEAKPSKIADNAVTTPKGAIVNFGNYVLQFEGPVPTRAELLQIGGALPRLDQSSLPPLRDYIPAKSLVPNSERYVLGPVSLDRFAQRHFALHRRLPSGRRSRSSQIHRQGRRIDSGHLLLPHSTDSPPTSRIPSKRFPEPWPGGQVR